MGEFLDKKQQFLKGLLIQTQNLTSKKVRLYCFNNPSEPNHTAHSFPIPLVSLRISMRFKTKNKLNFHFSTKTEAFFFPLHWSPQFKIHRDWTEARWERMSRPIEFAWKEKTRTYLNIKNRNFQKRKKSNTATIWHRLLLKFFRI